MNRAWLTILSSLLSIAPWSLSFAQAEQDETQAAQTMEQMQMQQRMMGQRMGMMQQMMQQLMEGMNQRHMMRRQTNEE